MEIQRQQRMTQKKSKEIKEISLSDDSNLILPEISYPTPYEDQPVKLGAKSTEQKQASEHDLLVYRQRLSRTESTLTPQEIKTLVYETNQRRTALEESIRQLHDMKMVLVVKLFMILLRCHLRNEWRSNNTQEICFIQMNN
jgi:hypothetical protein